MDAGGLARGPRPRLGRRLICVTGDESTAAALAARLDREADLHELRLDALRPLDDAVLGLIERHGPRLIVTCRPAREGGAYRGDETERLAWLERAWRRGARWIDLEHDVPDGPIPRDRTVRSLHDFDGGCDLRATVLAQRRRGAVVKVAQHVDDAADLAPLRALAEELGEGRVVIGMGAAGLVSRVRYRGFGSAWTYVAAEAGRGTAPGQLSWDEALRQGLPAAARRPFAALLGGSQVLRSPGPRRYPPLFRAEGLPVESYVPVVTERLRETLELLAPLGLVAASVTMPLKAQVEAVATQDATSRLVGAANSLRLRDGRWEATNTDVMGVKAPLAPHVQPGQTALILGAGGAAAAAAAAVRELGLVLRVSARSFDRAQRLAARHGGEAVPWARRGGPVDVVINATPLTGDRTPWPSAPLEAEVVFDLALGDEPRALRAQLREGTLFIDAESMWIHQGARQMGWAFDHAFDPEQLRG